MREERGLCYSIYAQSAAYEDTGQVTIYAGTSEAEIGELTRLTVDDLPCRLVVQGNTVILRSGSGQGSVFSVR